MSELPLPPELPTAVVNVRPLDPAPAADPAPCRVCGAPTNVCCDCRIGDHEVWFAPICPPCLAAASAPTEES